MKLHSKKVLEIPFLNPEELVDVIAYINGKKAFFQQASGHDSAEIHSAFKTLPMVAHYSQYNFLADNPHYANRLAHCVRKHLPWMTFPIAVQAWVNAYDQGQGIGWHDHCGLHDHSYTANIFVGGGPSPGVIYNDGPSENNSSFGVENQLGYMQLSNCSLFHKVPPNNTQETRYTIGLTLHDFYAITPDLLRGACLNNPETGVVLLK